ncbi:MAG: chemotaxis protein CheR, partial [Desulfobulbaceae bacterium]|nr:chemotaxis protein CheR [Desulfobulbaceae bacterium]
MEDNKCVSFLQWVLPQLNMRWKGFRKVRRQVCKRIDRRIVELGLTGLESYRNYLAENSKEWIILDKFCRITISRFYRDRLVFDYVSTEVLPVLVNGAVERKNTLIRVWSAGCASGEEPYTIALLWHNLIRPKLPNLHLEIIATDIDPVLIKRAREACYQQGSLRDLPLAWQTGAFDRQRDLYSLKQSIKEYVHFLNLDIRKNAPGGLFHIILCRNLAFTYLDQKLQRSVLERFYNKLEIGGVLISGTHEKMPDEDVAFARWVE